MYRALITLILLLLLSPISVDASQHEEIQRRIEVLEREIKAVRTLLNNMNSPQSISARSYLAVDLSSGSVLAQKNSNLPLPIASVTKLMSSIVARENIRSGSTVTLTPTMLRSYGSSPTLFAGLNISTENLLKASLIQSTNDAAESLAYTIGRSNFISRMNYKAAEIGMNDTKFHDPHGLSPQNTSTASDLALMMAYIRKNHPDILRITKENDFWMKDPQGNDLKFINLNNFYPLSSFIGGKSGYLPQALNTMASVFNVNGKPVALIVLNSSNSQADTFNILKRVDD